MTFSYLKELFKKGEGLPTFTNCLASRALEDSTFPELTIEVEVECGSAC